MSKPVQAPQWCQPKNTPPLSDSASNALRSLEAKTNSCLERISTCSELPPEDLVRDISSVVTETQDNQECSEVAARFLNQLKKKCRQKRWFEFCNSTLEYLEVRQSLVESTRRNPEEYQCQNACFPEAHSRLQ